MTTPEVRRRTFLLVLVASGERLLATGAQVDGLGRAVGVPDRFDEFWRRLGSVVSRRSWQGLRALCADPFRTSVDDPAPLEPALHRLRSSFNAEETFWAQLSRALRAGWEMDLTTADTILIPPSDKPPFSDDRTMSYVVGRRVRVRAAPHERAATIAYLSEEVVRVTYSTQLVEELPENAFVRISYEGGAGFVSRRYLILGEDYRMWCEKQHGSWKIAAIVPPE